MSTLSAIIVFSLLMGLIGLAGGVTLLFKESTLEKILLPLVAFAAGSLIGGALFHMLPTAVHQLDNDFMLYLAVAGGFVAFFVLEQLLSWHHCHRTLSQHKHPVTYLMLVSDSLHNFIDGVAVAASFMVDFGLGLTAWLVVAAHEIPQELGDFGIMIYGGWRKERALLFSFLSQLTFLIGALVTYFAAEHIDIDLLVPFAAGSFLYIGTVDLVPEIKAGTDKRRIVVHSLCFVLGLASLFLLHELLPHQHV